MAAFSTTEINTKPLIWYYSSKGKFGSPLIILDSLYSERTNDILRMYLSFLPTYPQPVPLPCGLTEYRFPPKMECDLNKQPAPQQKR